jgi:hypothetical protein
VFTGFANILTRTLSARSIGLCVIWVCISSSSSSAQLYEYYEACLKCVQQPLPSASVSTSSEANSSAIAAHNDFFNAATSPAFCLLLLGGGQRSRAALNRTGWSWPNIDAGRVKRRASIRNYPAGYQAARPSSPRCVGGVVVDIS